MAVQESPSITEINTILFIPQKKVLIVTTGKSNKENITRGPVMTTPTAITEPIITKRKRFQNVIFFPVIFARSGSKEISRKSLLKNLQRAYAWTAFGSAITISVDVTVIKSPLRRSIIWDWLHGFFEIKRRLQAKETV